MHIPTGQGRASVVFSPARKEDDQFAQDPARKRKRDKKTIIKNKNGVRNRDVREVWTVTIFLCLRKTALGIDIMKLSLPISIDGVALSSLICSFGCCPVSPSYHQIIMKEKRPITRKGLKDIKYEILIFLFYRDNHKAKKTKYMLYFQQQQNKRSSDIQYNVQVCHSY